MATRDIYHDTVVNALIKDGWTITHDPLLVPYGRSNLYVHLGAERTIGAERDGQKIAVEIKSFIGLSEVTDLERALGQYLIYKFVLKRDAPDRALFLAMPDNSFDSLFEESIAREFIATENLRLIVFNVEKEEIVRWIR